MARILVVDDEPQVRDFLVAALRRAGHRTEAVPNGAVGLERLRSETVDVVITDVFMPEADGIETIRQLRKHHPAVGIIAISGGMPGGNVDYLHLARMLGADHTLAKPFTVKDMLSAVDGMLAGGPQ